MSTWYTAEADSPAYRGRVDGDFTGTTDEIIQWASCKWGVPHRPGPGPGSGRDDVGAVLRRGRRRIARPVPDAERGVGRIPQLVDLDRLQRRLGDGAAPRLLRRCHGYSELRGNLDACIGVHYSGDPDESTWRTYTDAVLEHQRTKPWLQWNSIAGTPPTATREG